MVGVAVLIMTLFVQGMDQSKVTRIFFLLISVAVVLTIGVWLDRRTTPIEVAYKLGLDEGYRRGVRAHLRGEDNVTPLHKVTSF